MKKLTGTLLVGVVVVAMVMPVSIWASHPGARITGDFLNVYSAGNSEPILVAWSLGCNQMPVQDIMVTNSGETAIGVSIVDVGPYAGSHARFKITSSFGRVWFWRETGDLVRPCSTALEILTTAADVWFEVVIPADAKWMSAHRSGLNTDPSASWELYVCPVSPPTSTHPCIP